MMNENILKLVAKETGYTVEAIKRGYDFYEGEYIKGALRVEPIYALYEYELDIFDNDEDAKLQAEKDGYVFIKDIPKAYTKTSDDYSYYLDTPYNRYLISKALLKDYYIFCNWEIVDKLEEIMCYFNGKVKKEYFVNMTTFQVNYVYDVVMKMECIENGIVSDNYWID